MKTIQVGNGSATLILDRSELRAIHASLNEACNGIDIDAVEFPTRIGTTRDHALKLLSELRRIIDEAARIGQP